MKAILLPTDFSDNSWNAIEYALNFYKHATCNFYLLHVNRLNNVVVDDYFYDNTEEVIIDVNIENAKKQLKGLQQKIALNFNNKNHNFYTLTDTNFFIESIRQQVEEKNRCYCYGNQRS
ncbi:universal stress protein [Polaribacter sejongensis]|uniref:universal stress protein n=1 Tax=Polaribacter sejongensis TaxID=985043 RepID=UPI0035A71EE1